MVKNEIVQLKSYNENTGNEIGNVYPITNSEAVKIEDNKNLKEELLEINEKIKQTNSSLDNKVSLNKITSYGAIGDGVTPCDVAYSKAKTKGSVHFPQNESNSAVYYFENNADFNNIVISGNKGVTISLPTTNSISFKSVLFSSDIKIASRDRDNIGLQFKNDTPELVKKSFTDNDIGIGYKKLSVVENLKSVIYTANSGSTQEITINSNEGVFDLPNADVPNSTSKVLNIECDIEEKYMYSADFEFITQETDSTTTSGITVSDGTNTNWIHYGIRPNGTGVCVGNINGSIKVLYARNFSGVFTDAYKMKNGLIFSFRVVNKNKFQIFLNGVWLQTISTAFDIKKGGFGCLCVNIEGHGTRNTKICRIIKGYCEKVNLGNTFNIIGFGDSITFGEGAFSWLEYLPSLIEGQRGITKAKITNKASSGNSTVQQLPVMRNTDLSLYDCVCVMISTNDIQFQTSIETFTNNIREMITLAKGSNEYRKVIFGIPPLWISQSLTGEGAITSNYDKGSIYRSIIMYECAKADVCVADVMSEIGRINIDNVKDTLRDNLHLNCFGELLMARCFARSILDSIDN